MAKTIKTHEEALEAQKVAKENVKIAKTALTEYYTKNKLKRSEDYTKDKKHGEKITRLQTEIDKKSETLEAINNQVKDLKPAKAGAADRVTKYEYPADCVSSEDRKKYRIAQRKAAEGGDKPKKEKAEKEPKADKASKGKAKEAPAEEKAAPSKKKKKVSKEEPAKEEATSTKKKKKKVRTND